MATSQWQDSSWPPRRAAIGGTPSHHGSIHDDWMIWGSPIWTSRWGRLMQKCRLLDGIGAWMKKSGLEHGIVHLDLSKIGGITWNDHILWQFWRRGIAIFCHLEAVEVTHYITLWLYLTWYPEMGDYDQATSPSSISDQSAEEHSLCIQLVCICMENARERFVARENGKLHFNGCLRSFKRWIICFTGGSCFGSIPVLQHLQQPGNRESDSPQPWLQLLGGFPDRKRFPGCNCLDDCRAA